MTETLSNISLLYVQPTAMFVVKSVALIVVINNMSYQVSDTQKPFHRQ